MPKWESQRLLIRIFLTALGAHWRSDHPNILDRNQHSAAGAHVPKWTVSAAIDFPNPLLPTHAYGLVRLRVHAGHLRRGANQPRGATRGATRAATLAAYSTDLLSDLVESRVPALREIETCILRHWHNHCDRNGAYHLFATEKQLHRVSGQFGNVVCLFCLFCFLADHPENELRVSWESLARDGEKFPAFKPLKSHTGNFESDDNEFEVQNFARFHRRNQCRAVFKVSGERFLLFPNFSNRTFGSIPGRLPFKIVFHHGCHCFNCCYSVSRF